MKNVRNVLVAVILGVWMTGCMSDPVEEIQLEPSEIEQQVATGDSDEDGSIPPGSN